MKTKIKFLLLISHFLLVATSYSYSQSFTSSHVVGNSKKNYTKILVVVKAHSAAARVQAENDMVSLLVKRGLVAEPSYLRLTEKELAINRNNVEHLEAFVATLLSNNFDGALVTSLVDQKTSVEYNPAQYHATAAPVYGRFGRYYGTATVAVYEPASVEEHKTYVLEALLYDLRESTKENSLHWVGTIKVTDPSNYDKTSDKYASLVVQELIKKVIIID